MSWSQRRVSGVVDVRLGRQRSPERAQGPNMVPYLRAANVIDGRLDLDDVKSMDFSPDEQRLFGLDPGDVLVTEGSGSLETVGATAVYRGELPAPVCFQNTLLRLRPKSADLDRRYLAWWARGAFESGTFAAISTGANIYHLSAEGVKSLTIPMPPVSVQRPIADYLDRETQRIDSAINKNRRLIDLLTERYTRRREQLLSGIGTAAPRTHTSVPWFPTMPDAEGWSQVRLKHACVLQRGHDLPAQDRTSGPYPVVTSGGITDRHNDYKAAPPGVVTGRYGTVGEVHWVDEPFWPLNTSLYVIDFRGNDPRYIYHLLSSVPLAAESAKSAVGGINRNDVHELPVVLAPPWEQPGLATAVDEERGVRDRLAQALAEQNQRLTERRGALITAAVTGQLDLGQEAA